MRGDLVLNTHNQSVQLSERTTRSLIVNAHNIQVSLCCRSRTQGTQVGSATINGHNNYLFT